MRGRTLDLEVVDKRGKAAKTIPLYQYDYGQKLIIKGVELPEYYEVHFSNQQYGEAVTVLGDSTGVLIPDSLVATGESIYVWLYLHDTSYDGETEYMGVIPVIKRAEPSDVTPTPEEQSIITEVIAALNNMEDDMSDQVNEAKAAKEAAEDAQAGAEAAESAVEGYASAAATAKEAAETAQTAAETAQAAAEAASNAATTAYNNADSARASALSAKEYAETAATNASNSATSASNSATSASNSASAAEGYKTAAETAQGKAEDAQEAAEAAQAVAEAAEDSVEADALIAEGYAVGKQNGEDVASGSTYYHNNAKYYAGAASDSATAAAGSEDNAEDSAEDAEAYAVGTRGGVDVESDDPAYENNAKYYAEEAATVLADKLDAPATAGTAGQVLTSDGEGGQAWADPSGAIDDTAGEGDTDVTWSADKLAETTGQLLNEIHGLEGATDFIHNELGKAGRFSPETSWFKTYGCSEYSVDSNGVASILCIGQYGGIQALNAFHAPANHKIYAFSKLKGTEGARITFAWNGYAVATGTDDFHLASFIETWASDTDVSLMVVDASASDFQTIYAKDCGIIDLTATFGDVVPSKAQLDSFVSQVGFFENYPVGTFLRKFYTDYIKAGANGYPNLGNKTIVIMGDSITQQNSIDGNGNLTKIITNWPDYAMPLLGDPTVYNFAQDGSTYHDWSGSGTYQTFTKQYNLMVSKGINPDIIICAFGTNDYQHTHTDDYASALNVYSLEGLDKTNNYQSVRWAYWTLTQNYPNALIIVSTPIQRADIGVLTTDWIREAIKQMGNLYCINIADALIESGIISQFEKAPGYGAGRYLADGLHPNTAGKKLLGRYWAYKIAQYFSPDKFDKSDVS